MKTYLFACIHNAGRSQMAAAWFNRLAHPTLARALSAGTDPATRVHPEVGQAMGEVGIDLSGAVPGKLTDELARGATMLITMGCGDQCPVVPGLRRDDWPLEDPKGKPVERVREIRDEVRRRIVDLLDREGLAPRYTPADRSLRPAVVELLRSSDLPTDDLPPDLSHFFVARQADHLVGVTGLEVLGDVALLRSVAVLPGWRGRGVARALFEQALGQARSLGLRELFLFTTTARDIFAHWGFQQVPREAAPASVQATAAFRDLCPASAVFMRLALSRTQKSSATSRRRWS